MTEATNIHDTLNATGDAISEITNLMSAIDDSKVNTVPFPGSWTGPQLLRHITKSLFGMTNALDMEVKPAERNPGERIEQLKSVMLDFTKKLNQPDFIRPEEIVYEKGASIQELNEAYLRYKKSAETASLAGFIDGFPLGPITKLEIIHFVLYHTQRHLHQMKRICEALQRI